MTSSGVTQIAQIRERAMEDFGMQDQDRCYADRASFSFEALDQNQSFCQEEVFSQTIETFTTTTVTTTTAFAPCWSSAFDPSTGLAQYLYYGAVPIFTSTSTITHRKQARYTTTTKTLRCSPDIQTYQLS
jgi:hypothetical protein